jgi:Ca2+-binding EF-hand superfamily protein
MPISGDDQRNAFRERLRIGAKRERDLSRRTNVYRVAITLGLFLIGGPPVIAQSTAPPPRDPMLSNGPPVWDDNHDNVYTCDEWKKYADRIFTSADRNRDGKLDPSEFETVRKMDASLAEADFGYFDENQDGKITRKEFVEKPSAFILRFDRNGDCRVTVDEIKASNAPKGPQGPAERPRDRFH